MSIPLELKARYTEGRLIPFVGAGASMSVQWHEGGQPKRGLSWSALVDQAARLLGFDEPDLLRVRGSDLQILEYFNSKKHGEFAELRSWFEREMIPPDSAIKESPIHQALVGLNRCPLIYTTNYDDFIERALTLGERVNSATATEAHIAQQYRERARAGDAAPRQTEVVKFHGDLKSPLRMVLSESDYEKRMNFASVEDQRLKSDLLGRALVFIGYSFSDMNVSYLFRMVNETFGHDLPETATGRRAYIILSDPSDFEYTLFRKRNIEVIGTTGLDKAAAISGVLKELASA